jgi:hypothetical protein
MPATAQSTSASAYGVLTYRLLDTNVRDAIKPAVTFLNGPFSEGYTVNNYEVDASATNVIGYPYNPLPMKVLMGDADGTVKTVSAGQSFEMATGTGAVRIANNVGFKLATVSGQATAGGGVLGTEWDGQGGAGFAQAFVLTPYTSITFTFTPELSAIIDDTSKAQSPVPSAGATSYVQLGTGAKQANATYSMVFDSGLAQLDTASQAAGWNGGATFYDTALTRTFANSTSSTAYGAVHALVWTETFFYNPEGVAVLALANTVPVPEPATWALMLAGLCAMVGKRRRLSA